jgi:hypothetical protein
MRRDSYNSTDVTPLIADQLRQNGCLSSSPFFGNRLLIDIKRDPATCMLSSASPVILSFEVVLDLSNHPKSYYSELKE